MMTQLWQQVQHETQGLDECVVIYIPMVTKVTKRKKSVFESGEGSE